MQLPFSPTGMHHIVLQNVDALVEGHLMFRANDFLGLHFKAAVVVDHTK